MAITNIPEFQWLNILKFYFLLTSQLNSVSAHSKTWLPPGGPTNFSGLRSSAECSEFGRQKGEYRGYKVLGRRVYVGNWIWKVRIPLPLAARKD